MTRRIKAHGDLEVYRIGQSHLSRPPRFRPHMYRMAFEAAMRILRLRLS